jgi:hypothetical protein
MKWESVGHDNEGGDFERIKVPGGWFVRWQDSLGSAASVFIFYPDPRHEWTGNSLP